MALHKAATHAEEDENKVATKLRTRINAKGGSSGSIKLAFTLLSFKTTSNVEVLYTSVHLYQLEYQGDKNSILGMRSLRE